MTSEEDFQAIVLINADPGKEPNIERALRQFTQDQAKANGGHVVYAHSVYGLYDLVAKVASPSKEIYSNVLRKKIAEIDGVQTTLPQVIAYENV
jgi:DNA-binding Lrp family transcriptional regulator